MHAKLQSLLAQNDDRAVSPVIGVILMVAITVILAAVIGTMVLGMTDSVGQNVQAGANVQYDAANTQIRVTVTSLNSADYLTVSVDGADNIEDTSTLSATGNTATIDAPAGNSYHVVVTAHDADSGASTVVVEKDVLT